MDLLRAVAYLWALPNTLLGLLVGLLSFQCPRRAGGLLVFDGPPRGSLWVIRLFRRSAVTLGHVVLSNRPLEGALLAHERHHVWQYERLGPLYLPVYLLVWVFTGYRRHPFELAATLAEAPARRAGPA
ncbi:MAG TPA: hypothetical protein VHL78_03455 [Actinomycetota bacterium]|nr:hypothetical protein [Actinomycetota bacterium]